MRSFFVGPKQIAGSTAVLSGAEARHVTHVLRLRAGDEIRIFDGAGCEYRARIEALPPGRVELAVMEKKVSPGLPAIRVTVAQGILKEKKMDRLVRQLSELGASRFIPVSGGRSVVRLEGARAASRAERWRRIAVEALKQCGRGDVMEIADVCGFEQVLEIGRACSRRIVFWEHAAAPLGAETIPAPEPRLPPSSVMILLGPEGGFSEEEIRRAVDAGFCAASLGPRILRAETAAVAACALVQYLFGDLGAPPKKS
jgi:16S rRNA (uracil1498-N3)-methyltransferase